MPYTSFVKHFGRVIRVGLLVGMLISCCIYNSQSAQAAVQTQSGIININSIVPGAPPATAPTIDSPINGANFDTKLITIEGSCIAGLIVKVFSNSIFIGSALCQPSGSWSLQADLFESRNDLVARQYDGLNQPSPNSDTVTVYYTPPNAPPVIIPPESSPTTGPQTVGFQLKINYDYTVQGVFPNQVFHLPISFNGGTPPYAVGIDWGDGSSSIYSRSNDAEFMSEHKYKKPGTYTVVIKVSDAAGNSAYLQFVIIVNGEINSPVNIVALTGGILTAAWPILLLFVVSSLSMVTGILIERHYLVKRRL